MPVAVVKAQVHAGGRGKGGGVKLARTAAEAAAVAQGIMAKPLVTPQTGPQGVRVNQVMLTPAVEIAHEYYIGMVLNRTKACPMVIASAEGGVEIEEVAKKSPEKIFSELCDPVLGLYPFQARQIAFSLGFTGPVVDVAVKILQGIAQAYLQYDCTILEINPLVLTKSGELLALDSKISFDDNAVYRHESLYTNMKDETEIPATEIRAKQIGLSYVSMDGNIGCMVNGAGLAMATMDIIKYAGGQPANFLDVGGGVTKDQVREAFKLILSDARVKAILVNIFGGIAHCDVIAEGVRNAVQEIGLHVPVVVRLEGTHVEEGKKILETSTLNVITAIDMKDAAEKVVAAAQRVVAEQPIGN